MNTYVDIKNFKIEKILKVAEKKSQPLKTTNEMSAQTKNMSKNMSVFKTLNDCVLNFFDRQDVDGEIISAWNDDLTFRDLVLETIANLEKENKKRAKKPKDAPKNAKSAYLFFCQDMRDQVKQENSELTSKEITAKLGEMWKGIKDTDEAKKYNDLAVADKDRYKEEMANYVPSESSDDNDKPEKKKRAKKPKDAPKNAKSAYLFFCQEMRASVKEENPDMLPKEITVKLGEMWKAIKDTDEAKKYSDLAVADKDRYKEEMANYVPTEESEDDNSDKDTKNKKKRVKKNKDAPKNAKSAYMFFCQEMRASVKEENPDMLPKEITIKLGEMWKEIKETDEVKKYTDMANTDKDRYKEEMANYIPVESNEESDEEEKKEKKEKKTRNKKPKDAPKNAKSAYMFFCQEMRSKVKEDNEDLDSKEITTKLSEMWKEIKETDEAKKYNDLAAADKDRYKEEMDAYKSSHSDSDEDKKEKKKETKESKESKDTKDKKITKTKDTKKVTKSNEDIVREIIDNAETENITMKFIREELKKKGTEISKDELKEIITKINEDDD